MKFFWFFFFVVGTIVPLVQFYPFVIEHGLDMPEFFSQLFSNSVSKFFAADLLISWLVFLVWSFLDSRKNQINGWPLVLILNLSVGLSAALPLYLFFRERVLVKKT